MHMAEVRWVVYWVTVVVGGGIEVMMACWNEWRLSDSVCEPHVQRSNCALVMVVPLSLQACQSAGSCSMVFLICWSVPVSESVRCVIVGCCWEVMGGGGGWVECLLVVKIGYAWCVVRCVWVVSGVVVVLGVYCVLCVVGCVFETLLCICVLGQCVGV